MPCKVAADAARQQAVPSDEDAGRRHTASVAHRTLDDGAVFINALHVGNGRIEITTSLLTPDVPPGASLAFKRHVDAVRDPAGNWLAPCPAGVPAWEWPFTACVASSLPGLVDLVAEAAADQVAPIAHKVARAMVARGVFG
jgi:hypothetical protein